MSNNMDQRPEGPDETAENKWQGASIYVDGEKLKGVVAMRYPASPVEVMRATINAQEATIRKLQQANIESMHTIGRLMDEKKALQDWHDSHL